MMDFEDFSWGVNRKKSEMSWNIHFTSTKEEVSKIYHLS